MNVLPTRTDNRFYDQVWKTGAASFVLSLLEDWRQIVTLPLASLRLIQAAGRFLRTETDEGTFTILDKRLVSKRYGSQLLDALPPFRQEI